MCACDVVYTREILSLMMCVQHTPTAMYIDNKGASDIARDPLSTTSLKHIKRRHLFVREMQHAEDVILMPVESKNNTADMMTKELKQPEFVRMHKRLREGPFADCACSTYERTRKANENECA